MDSLTHGSASIFDFKKGILVWNTSKSQTKYVDVCQECVGILFSYFRHPDSTFQEYLFVRLR